jgi:hypothetical protein
LTVELVVVEEDADAQMDMAVMVKEVGRIVVVAVVLVLVLVLVVMQVDELHSWNNNSIMKINRRIKMCLRTMGTVEDMLVYILAVVNTSNHVVLVALDS